VKILNIITVKEDSVQCDVLVKVLSQCVLFEKCDPYKIINSSGFCLCSYSFGEEIYTRKEYDRALGIIIKGKATVYKDNQSKRVIMRQLAVRDTFGAAALFGSTERYASTICASGKQTQVAFVSQALMKELMEQNFEIAERYIIFLSDRIRFLNEKLDLHTSGSAHDKLLSYLRSRKNEGAVNMQRLSKELDIGRATLYRAVDRLWQEGLIEKDGKSIVLIENKKEEDQT